LNEEGDVHFRTQEFNVFYRQTSLQEIPPIRWSAYLLQLLYVQSGGFGDTRKRTNKAIRTGTCYVESSKEGVDKVTRGERCLSIPDV
jgi:hypothetical protein